ncbi:MAG: pyrrolysine--tRNA(Pyl) ligase large subunit [Desulfobacter sp.]|nr:MAG: pyrrolysine--tRNA(Pyl) ligase large subunit [Desulfobacter sp.]
MAEEKWTQTQLRRFKALGIEPDNLPSDCSTPEERNRLFQQIEKKEVQAQRKNLQNLLNHERKTRFQGLRERIEQALSQEGFTGVTTPTVITGQALKKMTIDAAHPLSKQVFWLNSNQCLRPMLAPNLYSLMKDLGRLDQRPIRFFEIGSCFRKESRGASHANEFTMLNLVEMGLPEEERHDRLRFLAQRIMAAAGIQDYRFESEDSNVYGETLDVVAGPDDVEVASGAMGPHALDVPWGITDTWVGMGFGLERLLMISNKDASIGKWAKSLAYLDGISLKI